MGYEISTVKSLAVFTDKPNILNAKSHVIWIISSSTGSPKSYYLSAVFICEKTGTDTSDSGFAYYGRSHELHQLNIGKTIDLTTVKELTDIKDRLGRFAFGFSELTNAEYMFLAKQLSETPSWLVL